MNTVHYALCTYADDELVSGQLVQRTLTTTGATGWTDGGVFSMSIYNDMFQNIELNIHRVQSICYKI